MKSVHPFTQYSKALLMNVFELTCEKEITAQHIKEQIEVGLNHFRVSPLEVFEGKEKVKYGYVKIEKGNTNIGVFLSPFIVSEDKGATKTFAAAESIIQSLNDKGLYAQVDAKKNAAPLTGEYLSFNIAGGISRGKPKCPLVEIGLNMVTTLTPYKPCIYQNSRNFAIIPELKLAALINFIGLFKDMMQHNSSSDLFIGRVKKDKPNRPQLYNGNFPNPPKSTALGGIALLATIGEFAKLAEYSQKALGVLESLKDATMYMVKYGNANSFVYNHHVIELAKQGNLRQIVDSIYYSKLYNQSHRDYNNTEYQKFDLFSARFLQLYNSAAFKDFLAFRAEYPNQVEILFNTYFIKMEKIDIEIVKSARQLGKWLNLVAYYTAKAEVKEDSSNNYWEKLREQKAKVLVELESAAFSAKTGDALIAQVITRAGRLSGKDVPPEADLFMEKSMSGKLTLEQAQNMIIAFSRLKNAKESKEANPEEVDSISKEEIGINKDL